MATLRTLAVLFFTFTIATSAFSDEAFDFFVETCRHSGYNPAEIVTFQAELKVVSQTPPTDSDVEAHEQEREREKDEAFVAGSNIYEVEKQEMRKALEGMRKQMTVAGETTQFIKISLRNSAAPLGLEDTLVQAVVETVDDDVR